MKLSDFLEEDENEEEDILVDEIRCESCNCTFEIYSGCSLKQCPGCGIDFIEVE